MMQGSKVDSNVCLHTNCYLLLTRQTPTRSRFACKSVGLEVVAGLRKLRRNGAIRGIRVLEVDSHIISVNRSFSS